MSIESEIKERLVNNGLFPDSANIILGAMKADPANKEMERRWNDEPNDCPPILMAIAWLSAKRHALKWIDDNLPKAWYRPLFTESTQTDDVAR